MLSASQEPELKRAANMTAYSLHFLRNENGATAIEYGLIVAGIALTILGALNAFGQALSNNFFNVIANAVAP